MYPELELSKTGETAQRIEYSKKLNDIIVQNYWLIPLIHRANLSASSNTLGGVRMNGWDSELWNIADWYRDVPDEVVTTNYSCFVT